MINAKVKSNPNPNPNPNLNPCPTPNPKPIVTLTLFVVGDMIARAIVEKSKYRITKRTPQKHTYGTAKKKRPGYLVGNLVATNWPIEKALHAIGYNQIPTK